MMTHSTFREQGIAEEEMPVDDGSPSLRKCRGRNAKLTMQLLHQRFHHGPDVACRRGVEGGTNFEIDLFDALVAEPPASAQRLFDRGRSSNGSRFESDYDRVCVDWLGILRNVDVHRDAHA